MKKIVSLLLVAVLCMGFASIALADKMGMGIVTSAGRSAAATADADGTAIVNTTVCAVTLDDAGVIVAISFDASEGEVTFNAKGELTSDITTAFVSRNELGEDYGMKAASPIGKEYYEQMEALEAFCIGKTVDEVINTPADDADLMTAATITLTDHFAALVKAAANAQ